MFDNYIALGDSMSIDYYPEQDAEKAGLPIKTNLGAVSLLQANISELFPEFANKDLLTANKNISCINLALDGAVCEDLRDQIESIEMNASNAQQTLITLTQGGNDLLQVYRKSKDKGKEHMMNIFTDLLVEYKTCLDSIRSKLPSALLVISTVYDPTDGTGVLPAHTSLYADRLPIEFLNEYNNFVRSCAEAPNTVLADVHKHFLGHGAECGSNDNFWYWKPSPIEPGYRGASEIRRVWLNSINLNLQQTQ